MACLTWLRQQSTQSISFLERFLPNGLKTFSHICYHLCYPPLDLFSKRKKLFSENNPFSIYFSERRWHSRHHRVISHVGWRAIDCTVRIRKSTKQYNAVGCWENPQSISPTLTCYSIWCYLKILYSYNTSILILFKVIYYIIYLNRKWLVINKYSTVHIVSYCTFVLLNILLYVLILVIWTCFF